MGTHQMPLIRGSEETSLSTMSISGPWGVMGTFIISMPKVSVTPK